LIVCPNHEKQIPMFQTLAFIGAELWCPCCGASEGFPLGKYETVDNSPELQKKANEMQEATAEYLHAVGIPRCSSTMWKGERITPDLLPQEEKDRLSNIRENFKHLPEQ